MKRLRLAGALAFALMATAGFWFLLPNSLFYANRRPTRLGRLTNRAMGWLTAVGCIPIQATLEVRGRRTGETRSAVLVVAHYAGERYLVSMLGETSEWVHNLRAAGGHAILHHGRREAIEAVELAPELRAPILKAYLEKAFGARPHFIVGPDAQTEAFARIAGDYPVFRILAKRADQTGNRSPEDRPSPAAHSSLVDTAGQSD